MSELRVLATMGVQGPFQAFGPEFEAAHGVTLAAEFMPTVRLLERIRAGEHGDVAILTAEAVDALIKEGVLTGRTDLARSFIGVAVKAGAPHPDISDADAFIATLRNSASLAMSQAGASGIYMAGLLERLGLADELRAKTTILSSGFTASLAASGAVELAIQQVSELRVVDGVEIVGRIPSALGGETVFSAGPFSDAPNAAMGRQLIAALSDPSRASLYERCGLEPI